MASLSRLIWQLMAYAIATSTVVKLGQLISKLLRRWLGLSLKAFPKKRLYIRQTPDAYQFDGGVI